jgi:hypothetical protein
VGRPVDFVSFDRVLRALTAGEIDVAVLPAATRGAGPVLEPLEALARALDGGAKLVVASEIEIPVRLVLAVPRGVAAGDVKEIHSQSPVFRQCAKLLARLDATPVETHDTAQAALRVAFGTEKVQNEVSAYYIANEVRMNAGGMSIALEPAVWDEFQTMKPAAFAKKMVEWASHAQLPKYKRHPRGPKKPVPKRTRFPDKTHVSTARLLAESRRKSP